MSWRLSEAADEDLVGILETGAESFGIDAAERYVARFFPVFELIAENPRMGRVQTGRRLTARVLPRGSHMIVYTVEPDGDVLILRLPHQREDWVGLFG